MACYILLNYLYFKFELSLSGIELEIIFSAKGDIMIKKIILIGLVSSSCLLAIESENLYKFCVQCHGKHADKVAVKQSPRLSSLGEEELSVRLKKILDGSSSLSKKFITMHKIKLKYLTPGQTDEFAKYIIELKKSE